MLNFVTKAKVPFYSEDLDKMISAQIWVALRRLIKILEHRVPLSFILSYSEHVDFRISNYIKCQSFFKTLERKLLNFLRISSIQNIY